MKNHRDAGLTPLIVCDGCGRRAMEHVAYPDPGGESRSKWLGLPSEPESVCLSGNGNDIQFAIWFELDFCCAKCAREFFGAAVFEYRANPIRYPRDFGHDRD